MGQGTLVLLTLVVVAGVASSLTPPLGDALSYVPYSNDDYTNTEEDDTLTANWALEGVNWGLEGVGMQALWDKYTVEDVEEDEESGPMFEHPDLMGEGPTIVVGKTMKTIKDRLIYAFQGIKYADGPRFQKPVPATKFWDNDTLIADHLGFKCPQKAMLGHVPSGDADCLNLNVYTPYLPDELPGEKLPVMFFIHGGAFISGDSSLYLPTKLLDQDVILVVIHYRLGTLGFFCLQNDNAPGNIALWDQIEAMRWVQDNIEGFGGDPGRVTIFGESAGSASVNWHLLLPESDGLFQRVIGESGSALEHWSHDPDPIGSAILIAWYNGCTSEAEDMNIQLDEIYDCMMTKTDDELAMNMAAFVGYDRSQGGMGFKGAAPVTQDNTTMSLENVLISKHPEDYLNGNAEDGKMKDIPLMIGCNKHEGSFVLGIMYNDYLVANNLTEDKDFMRNDMLDVILNAFGVSDITHGISESLKDAYIGEADLADLEECSPGLIDLVGVFFLKAGAWMTAKEHAKYTNSDTFFYSFDFESDDSMFRWLFMGHSTVPFEPGVTHSDELMYLFPFPAEMEGQQVTVYERMVKLWTNFAKYGNPTPEEDQDNLDKLGLPTWKSLVTEEHNYYLIQDECSQEVEYPDRWHIAYEEANALPDTTTSKVPDSTPTSEAPDTTTTTTTTTEAPTEKPPITQAELDKLQKERDAYMISMIVFVVVSVALGLGCAYFYMKKR